MSEETQEVEASNVKDKAFNLLKEIRSVTLATVDRGKPAARIVDLMMIEDDRLYFITARGKPMYKQMQETPFVAIAGMTKGYVAIRIEGQVSFLGDSGWVQKILETHPALRRIYGDKTGVLEVYVMESGKGEIFDISTTPPSRVAFSFGKDSPLPKTYAITDKCTACGFCEEACPTQAITSGEIYSINGFCLACGACVEVCPEDAICMYEEL